VLGSVRPPCCRRRSARGRPPRQRSSRDG